MEQLLLHLVVGSKHSQIKSDCSDNRRGSSSPKSEEPVLTTDPHKSINNVFIVPSLSDRQLTVSLHSDQGQIWGVADQ